MKASAIDICNFLIEKKRFESKIDWTKDFEVTKVHYQYDDELDLGIDNCLIITNPSSQLISCKNSLALIYSSANCIKLRADSIFISSIDPIDTYISLIQKFALDEPYGIDEMVLRNHKFIEKNTIVQRCLYDNSLEFGYNQLIGIDGGRYYNNLPKNIPMIGGVKIGKNVTIGNNVTIYRGVTGFTEIGDNTIIQDNVIIAPDACIPNDSIIYSFSRVAK